MTKLLLLDYDGVIRFLDLLELREELEPLGVESSKLFEMLFGNDAAIPLIEGKITRKQWWDRVCELHPVLDQLEQDDIWNLMNQYSMLNQGLLDYLGTLPDDITVAILTNAEHGSMNTIEDQMEGRSIDHIFSSANIGYAKPKPEAFNYVMKQTGVLPTDIVFVDDSQKNVEGAADLGIHAILYQDLDHLQETVREYLLDS